VVGQLVGWHLGGWVVACVCGGGHGTRHGSQTAATREAARPINKSQSSKPRIRRSQYSTTNQHSIFVIQQVCTSHHARLVDDQAQLPLGNAALPRGELDLRVQGKAKARSLTSGPLHEARHTLRCRLPPKPGIDRNGPTNKSEGSRAPHARSRAMAPAHTPWHVQACRPPL
jgi:hypothetical protein